MTKRYPAIPYIIVLLMLGLSMLLTASFSFKKKSARNSISAIENDSISLSDARQERLVNAQEMLFTNPGRARRMARKNIDCIELRGGTNYEKYSYVFLIGSSYFYQAHYNKALRYYYRVLEYGLAENDMESVANVYHNIGLVNLKIRNYKDAIEFIQTSIDKYEGLGITTNQYLGVNNMGRIYWEIDDMDRAGEYFKQAYNKFVELDYKLGISSASNHLALYYQSLNKPDSAIYFFEQAYEISKNINSNYGLCVVHNALGDFYLAGNDVEQAFRHYMQSDSIASRFNYVTEECFPKLGLARAYLHYGNIDLALDYAKKAFDIASELNNYDLLSSSNEVLSLTYANAGDLANAYLHYRNAVEMRRQLTHETGISRVYNIELEQMKERLERRDLELEKQELLLDLRKYFIILVAAASLTIIALITLFYKNYLFRIRQAQRERLHQEDVKHTRELAKAAMEAELQERKRMGMELHDGLGPLLSLAKLNITGVLENNTLNEEGRSLLLKSTQSLHEIQKEVKQISNNLSPITLSENGLKKSIHALVTKVKQLEKFDIALKLNNFDESFSTHAEHAIYRTIQELVNNIITHANASSVIIEFVRNEKDITIMVEDNGVGFDVAGDERGQGLKSAVSRINNLGGELIIDSMKGRGTIVTIIMPVMDES